MGWPARASRSTPRFNDLSRSLTALNQGRGDFFAVVRSLALFVNALHADDQKFVALNKNLVQFTNSLTGSDRDLANAIQQFDGLVTTLRPFLAKNREVLTHDINNLADRDQHAAPTRPAERFGNRPARSADGAVECQSDLPSGASARSSASR